MEWSWQQIIIPTHFPAEILIDGDQVQLARKRQTFQNLVEGEEG
jgi:hypothetical protein